MSGAPVLWGGGSGQGSLWQAGNSAAGGGGSKNGGMFEKRARTAGGGVQFCSGPQLPTPTAWAMAGSRGGRGDFFGGLRGLFEFPVSEHFEYSQVRGLQCLFIHQNWGNGANCGEMWGNAAKWGELGSNNSVRRSTDAERRRRGAQVGCPSLFTVDWGRTGPVGEVLGGEGGSNDVAPVKMIPTTRWSCGGMCHGVRPVSSGFPSGPLRDLISSGFLSQNMPSVTGAPTGGGGQLTCRAGPPHPLSGGLCKGDGPGKSARTPPPPPQEKRFVPTRIAPPPLLSQLKVLDPQ